MQRPVLKDPELEAKFQKDGYVIIDFISDDEVEALKAKFFELLPTSGGNITNEDSGATMDITYDFTFIDKNIDFKRTVFDEITKVFADHWEKWLDNYKPIIANYIRKQNNDGEVPLHQNWAFVDETKCTSISIWCPLVDSNEENGVLQVVPGSHKRYGEVRGPMVPWELEGIKHDIIDNHLIPCNIKAGQAVILDDSIVHYSAINKTNDLRLAIQLIMIPAEEPSIHYHMNHEDFPGIVKVLEVDKEFYMQFNPWKKPGEGVKVVNEFPFQPFNMTADEFKGKLFGPRIDDEKVEVAETAAAKPTFFEKLKAVFS